MLLLSWLACTTPDDTAPPADVDDQAPVAHAVTGVHVAPAEDAYDLDGDGAPDNAVAALGSVLDPLLAERLASNVHVVVLQVADPDAWTDDPSVRVGLISAVDTDHDGADNASGSEVVDARGYLDAAGKATIAADTALAAGRYAVDVPADTFQVGTITFAVATPVHVDAAASAEAQSGVITFGVTTDALADALAQEHVDDGVIGLMTGLADLDLDGDGTDESLSLAFAFDAHVVGLIDRPLVADEGNRDGECAFNAECPADQRCDCVDYTCTCADGARGDGANGVDTCATGSDCWSSLCVEGADAFYCSDACATNDDCGPALPACTDVAFVGRICIRD